MPLISKPNYNQIFASQAPEQDKPAVFNNYPGGWGVESRPNNGKPTIKGFNYLQQTSDLKDLWILQNGACLPYDESIEYAEGAPVLKDGVIQYKTAGGFKSRDAVTVPTYNNAADGIDPVTGVADGAYFNVRSSSDESYIDEYQNIGGVPTPSGKSYPSSAALVGVREAVEKLQRENVSVWDFFTPAELASYQANPTTFDAFRPIQAFFDYIRLNDVGTAYCSGVFRTSQTIRCGLASASLTKTVVGDLALYALNATDVTFDGQTGSDFTWVGSVKTYGTNNGTGAFIGRTCRVGIRLGGNADRTTWGLLRAQHYYEIGVQFYNKTTMLNAGRIRAFDCGSGYEPGSGTVDYSLRSSYTHNSNTGSSASAAQRSILDVITLPPADLETNIYVVINNRAYWVSAIDRTNSRITVFPWVDSNHLSGSLRYIFGAGVDVFGGDASVMSLDIVDTMRCSVGYSSRTLYPATIGILTTQANAVGLTVGSRTDSASIGGCINQLYTELNNFDIFPLSRGAQNFAILNTTALNYSKINYFAPRTSANAEGYSFYGLNGFIIGGTNGFQMLSKPPRNTNIVTTINLSAPTIKHIHRKANSVFNLTYEQNLNDAFGYDATELTVIGTAVNNLPTQVTFNPDSGRTVNGKASEVFSGFTKIPKFNIFFDIATNNYVVISTSDGLPQTSVTYDPPSILANGTETTTVTLAGAALGNNISAAFSRYNSGIKINAQVSAANTVTVEFENTTESAIDLQSGTLTVKLL